jgi:metal-responsive CopG/Arc/MetJ family transcriptional regulator
MTKKKMGRPICEDRNSIIVQKSVALSRELWDTIDIIAINRGVGRSNLIREIIEQYFEEHQ